MHNLWLIQHQDSTEDLNCAEKSIFLILHLPCSSGVMAQSKSISGVITDVTSETPIGASTIEVGSTNETITALDCKFSQTVALVTFHPKLERKTLHLNYQSNFLETLRNNIETTSMNAYYYTN